MASVDRKKSDDNPSNDLTAHLTYAKPIRPISPFGDLSDRRLGEYDRRCIEKNKGEKCLHVGRRS